MGYQHVYTIDKIQHGVQAEGCDETFVVTKHDKALVKKGLPLTEVDQRYKVVRSSQRSSILCDCYAGLMGKQCRHIEMVLIAEDANNLNTGKFFDFEKKCWLK